MSGNYSPAVFPKIKLKKAETVKRPIEEAKLEVVALKHHDFENIPQNPCDEQTSKIKMTSKGELLSDEKEKKVKKVKKIVKKPKSKEEELSKEDSPSIADSTAEIDEPKVKEITLYSRLSNIHGK